MIETKEELLKGKSTLIKNKQYLSAKDYCQPFFDKLDILKPDYIIRVKPAEQVSITNNNTDIVYNKVHIQAILPTTYYEKNNCRKVVGFVYGLDLKTPVAKFYIADIDGYGNLYAFDLTKLIVQELEPETAINYNSVDSLLSSTDTNNLMIEQLNKTEFDKRNNMVHRLGEWINSTLNYSYTNEGGKIKLSTTMPVDVYKSLLLDKDSDHYIMESNPIMMSNVFRSFASIIRNDKDIVNNFEKTFLVSKVLGL